MSYCRFSSDNWKSDVCVYESADGFEVHVATNRMVGEIPPLLVLTEENREAYLDRYQEQMTAVEAAERVPINGPHDGKSFTFGTVQGLFFCLKGLQDAGYHVPQFVFEAIEEEMNEEPTQ
jgi:hypothetical protein